MREKLLLGAITGAHGTKGEVKVKSFALVPEDIGAYGPLATEDGRVLSIASMRPARPGEMIVAFKGVTDRNQAEGLKGTALYVARAQLPPLEPGEYYQADLVGLVAQDRAGKALGQVKAVHNFGAGDIVEIEFSGGGNEFVPLTEAHVPLVDIAGGRIVIEMPVATESPGDAEKS